MTRWIPLICLLGLLSLSSGADVESAAIEDRVAGEFTLANVVPPLLNGDDPRSFFKRPAGQLPFVAGPYAEQVKQKLEASSDAAVTGGLMGLNGFCVLDANGAGYLLGADDSWSSIEIAPVQKRGVTYSPRALLKMRLFNLDPPVMPVGINVVTDFALIGDVYVVATPTGLHFGTERHQSYGVEGPLATEIRALAVDTEGTLWVGTPLGLSLRNTAGEWRHIRGADGLPYEDVTSLAFDGKGRLWIGTTRGAIQYRPAAEGRQWFYRAGGRYLPNDHVIDVAVTEEGATAYFVTQGGVGKITEVTATLEEKAEIIEKRINERHRRLGLVAACMLDDADTPTSHVIGDNDNDGLWTAYHVAAMSLAYAVTGKEEYKASARESMHALVMLQNASGTPGLVARSVVPPEIGRTKNEQWRLTPDGTMYWKSDTSSDEIDGHYLAFYAYWEHIAKDDPKERDLIVKQCRDLTNYLVDNGYLLLDWDGEHTRWGFWSPEMLNGDAQHYLENGLNSLQMLSFLKVARHVTGDVKFKEHFDKLITEHHYLNNVLLSKKVFPDQNNHSDNQLGYVAWYPILQLEHDPRVRTALHQGVRRHYITLARDKSSFFNLVTATIDPDYVDIEGAIEDLRNIPTDRRNFRMENSHRTDLVWHPYLDRFEKRQLITVLPVDERDFQKWNRNPYIPDEGGDPRHEDDGSSYLLPYWMARYHGFIE